MFIVVALLSLLVAQPVKTVQPVNPCAALGNPPTVASCWGCFQSMLGDCDGATTVERRKACYEGANTFFAWCLGRTTQPGSPVSPRPSTRPNTMNSGEGYSYTIKAPGIVPADIVVFVRDNQGNEQDARAIVLQGAEEGTLDVFFADAPIGLKKVNSIGVVTAVRQQGVILGGFAQVVEIVNDLDINGDGVVDKFDYIEATNAYAAGDMSFEMFHLYTQRFFDSN